MKDCATDLMNGVEVARALGVSRPTVDRIERDGYLSRLPQNPLLRKQTALYPRAQVEALKRLAQVEVAA